jgi:hypothetical protein
MRMWKVLAFAVAAGIVGAFVFASLWLNSSDVFFRAPHLNLWHGMLALGLRAFRSLPAVLGASLALLAWSAFVFCSVAPWEGRWLRIARWLQLVAGSSVLFSGWTAWNLQLLPAPDGRWDPLTPLLAGCALFFILSEALLVRWERREQFVIRWLGGVWRAFAFGVIVLLFGVVGATVGRWSAGVFVADFRDLLLRMAFIFGYFVGLALLIVVFPALYRPLGRWAPAAAALGIATIAALPGLGWSLGEASRPSIRMATAIPKTWRAQWESWEAGYAMAQEQAYAALSVRSWESLFPDPEVTNRRGHTWEPLPNFVAMKANQAQYPEILTYYLKKATRQPYSVPDIWTLVIVHLSMWDPFLTPEEATTLFHAMLRTQSRGLREESLIILFGYVHSVPGVEKAEADFRRRARRLAEWFPGLRENVKRTLESLDADVARAKAQAFSSIREGVVRGRIVIPPNLISRRWDPAQAMSQVWVSAAIQYLSFRYDTPRFNAKARHFPVNPDGSFTLRGLPNGTYRLLVSIPQEIFEVPYQVAVIDWTPEFSISEGSRDVDIGAFRIGNLIPLTLSPSPPHGTGTQVSWMPAPSASHYEVATCRMGRTNLSGIRRGYYVSAGRETRAGLTCDLTKSAGGLTLKTRDTRAILPEPDGAYEVIVFAVDARGKRFASSLALFPDPVSRPPW